MSDLDADLYGDLYGNDELETEQPLDDVSAQVEEVNSTVETAAPLLPTSESSSKPPSMVQEVPGVAGTHTNGSAVSSVPSYSQQPPPPQKIPTYEQPQSNEYREIVAPRQEAMYQGIQVNERSIRPSEMKDEGKMFIGGLNWDTTDEGLRDYFSQFGKVDACTIMRDAAGRSRCFAFLTFEEPASVNAVMVREHVLDGKIIDPKRAIPRQEHQRATKLFIGGLAGSVTSESMREFFSQFGKVVDSTVMLDRETGRSKGFGFVSLEDVNVQPLLGFGNLEIDGKLIDVKLAQPRYQRDNYQNEDGSNTGGGNDFQAGGGGGGGVGVGARFNTQQSNFSSTPAVGLSAGNTPFDPQALAALYTRMFQMSNAGMNPAMMGAMGGMNPLMAAGMGNAGFPGSMRPGMGMGMGMGGMGGGPGMPGMGRGGGQGMMAGAGGINPNIPRGPRGGGGPPGGMGTPAGVGPQRTGQRGQHNFHPYAR